MAITVLDGNDLQAIAADAGVILETKTADVAQDKTVEPVQPKIDQEPEEDENGLTESERKELSKIMQKQIGKKHRMMREAEEFAASQYSERKLAEERASRLAEELEAIRLKANPAPEKPPLVKPDRTKFSSDSDYIDASIQYGVDVRLEQKAAEDAKIAAQHARDELIENARSRVELARSLVPDFDEVISANDPLVPPAVAGYMEKSEMIAELGYYFAKNPDVVLSLSKMQPDVQLVKVGRIESTITPFGSGKATKDEVLSNPDGKSDKTAPRADTELFPSKSRNSASVIKPIDALNSSVVDKSPKDMNIREVITDYQKKKNINLGLRKRH